MYVFGGREEEGHDLGDLISFDLRTRHWYVFQITGNLPSPRCGHSMTSYGYNIVIVGGQPSASNSADTQDDLTLTYTLDITENISQRKIDANTTHTTAKEPFYEFQLGQRSL